jgi:transposase
MFSYVSPERRIPADHPLRPIRAMTDEVLRQLSPRFARLYPKTGRPSVAPEKLLLALLLQVLYSVRSERLLMEQLEYNLLFRWFVGLSINDPVWDVTVFTKNRERLLRGDIAEAFFQRVLELARGERLLSDEHFSLDGTLIQAWAGQKSFVRKGTTPRRRTIREIRRSTATGRSVATPRTPRSPTPTRSSSRRRRDARPSSATSGTCSSRIATGSW